MTNTSTPNARRSIHADSAANAVADARLCGFAARPASLSRGIQVSVSHDPIDGEYLVSATSATSGLLRPIYRYRGEGAAEEATARMVELLRAFSAA